MLLSETGKDVTGCLSFPAVRRIEALLNPGDLKIITTAARAAGLDDAWAIPSSQGSAIAYRPSVIRPQGEVVHRAGLEPATF